MSIFSPSPVYLLQFNLIKHEKMHAKAGKAKKKGIMSLNRLEIEHK